MGTKYGIQLYIPLEQLETALNEIAEITYDDGQYMGKTNLRLPNGKKVLVPLDTTQLPRNRELKINDYDGRIEFTTNLLFLPDDVINQYLTGLPFPMENYWVEKNGLRHVRVGNLWVIIFAGEKYVHLDVSTVSGSQNTMFLRSKSIHDAFLRILKACNGIAGLIDIEQREYPLLSNPSKHIELVWDHYSQWEDNLDIDIDKLTQVIIQKIAELE